MGEIESQKGGSSSREIPRDGEKSTETGTTMRRLDTLKKSIHEAAPNQSDARTRALRELFQAAGLDLEKIETSKDGEFQEYLDEYRTYSPDLLQRVLEYRVQYYRQQIAAFGDGNFSLEKYGKTIELYKLGVKTLQSAKTGELPSILAATEYVLDFITGKTLLHHDKPSMRWPDHTFVATVSTQWAAMQVTDSFDYALLGQLEKSGNVVNALRLLKARGCRDTDPSISHLGVRAFEKTEQADRRVVFIYSDRSFFWMKDHGELRGKLAADFHLDWPRDTRSLVGPTRQQVKDLYAELRTWARTPSGKPKELLIYFKGHGETAEAPDGRNPRLSELNAGTMVDRKLDRSDWPKEGSLQGVFWLGNDERITEDELKKLHRDHLQGVDNTTLIFNCCHSSAFQP